MKDKILTFSAGIIGTCVFGILTLINTISMVMSFVFLYEFIYFGIIGLFIVVFDVLALVFNSCAIKCRKYEVFAKNQGIIIAAVVLNFLLIIYGFCAGLTIFFVWALIFSMISIPALICANVFYIVDLARKPKPVNNTSIATNDEESMFVELERIARLREKEVLSQEEFERFKAQIFNKQVGLSNVNSTKVKTQSLSVEEKMYVELERISSLKEKGVLNDEEFNTFKAQIVEKLIKNK